MSRGIRQLLARMLKIVVFEYDGCLTTSMRSLNFQGPIIPTPPQIELLEASSLTESARQVNKRTVCGKYFKDLYHCTETRRVLRRFSTQKCKGNNALHPPKRSDVTKSEPNERLSEMRFDDNPQNDEMYCFPIVRPRHRHPIAFTVCTETSRGCWTHWFGGKTIACSLPNQCEPCMVNVKRTWAGHLLAYRHEDDQIIMVIFTKPVQPFFVRHQDPQGHIMGVSCRLVRMGGRETGPVAAVYLGRDKDRQPQRMSVLETVINRLYSGNANKHKVKISESDTQ